MALAELKRAQQSARDAGLEQTHVKLVLVDQIAVKLGIPLDAPLPFKVDAELRHLLFLLPKEAKT